MKATKTALIIIGALFIGGLCSWVLRGEYDQHFMMEGHFHIVSNAQQDHDITITFPSEERIHFTLRKGGSFDFRQLNTGEGSVTISIDGKRRDHVGYVTSMNGIVVLVIGDTQTQFSQIFPSLNVEQRDLPKPLTQPGDL
jgi:hypothetical protein